jgi:hypothetical protein
MKKVNLFYKHGNIKCNDCFISEKCILDDGWQLNNNPSSTPEILVLGYSKGTTQMKRDIPFDDIAFKGMRNRLKEILVLMNLIDTKIEIDSLFTKEEKKFGFASLIRCGISHNNKTSDVSII